MSYYLKTPTSTPLPRPQPYFLINCQRRSMIITQHKDNHNKQTIKPVIVLSFGEGPAEQGDSATKNSRFAAAVQIMLPNVEELIILHRSMDNAKKYLALALTTLMSVVGYVPALIYSYVFSQFFTKATYRLIGERNHNRKGVKQVLDIGTATGHPLHSIIDNFKDSHVLGIDYNPHYVPACKKLFEAYTNVQIRQMNYYDLQTNYPETLFDVIIFGSSFMIMPDQTKAIEIAKRCLSKNGRIYFLLTLYEEKNAFNKIMEYVKPMLKYLSTIDFGQVTYRSDFEAFLIGHNLKLTVNERCSGNFFLKLFKFYIYEAEKL